MKGNALEGRVGGGLYQTFSEENGERHKKPVK
jgi:hypothetical protein